MLPAWEIATALLRNLPHDGGYRLHDGACRAYLNGVLRRVRRGYPTQPAERMFAAQNRATQISIAFMMQDAMEEAYWNHQVQLSEMAEEDARMRYKLRLELEDPPNDPRD